MQAVEPSLLAANNVPGTQLNRFGLEGSDPRGVLWDVLTPW